MKPQEAIDRLLILCPCDVLHTHPEGRQSRSSYWSKGTYRGGHREQDFIYMNEPGRSWHYVHVLAHEVGHALDAHGLHPAQDRLGMVSGYLSRYRIEMAAVFCEVLACEALGMTRMKLVQRRIEISKNYVRRYKRSPNMPLLDDLITDENRDRVRRMLLFPLPPSI